MNLSPIGTYQNTLGADQKYSVPRQGSFHPGHPGMVHLNPHSGFEDALRDLDGFERIWLLFLFDRNPHWRPTVRPPVPPADHERVGVFASRSPYRPNPIGLSCVRLTHIEGITLHVDECDLLDHTPILDIKPYIPKADAFPNAKAGWVDSQPQDCWTIETSPVAQEQASAILHLGGPDLLSTAIVQLRENPFDTSRKRIRRINNTLAILSFRMFRLRILVDPESRQLTVHEICSGYNLAELENLNSDPYQDKNLHCMLVNNRTIVPVDNL